MSRDVDLLVGQQGDLADAAEERLVARGRDAIVHLESGLYSAEPPARRRIIRALAAIGDREALPILDHLARRDPDDYTRAAAAAAAAKLRGGP